MDHLVGTWTDADGSKVGSTRSRLPGRHEPSEWLLAATLMIRGAGLGAATIAVMAGAFQGVPRGEVPDASSTTRIVQQVGGSLGAAMLAVILAGQLTGSGVGGAAPRGAAFNVAFWWAIGFGLLALLPALPLPNGLRTPRPSGSASALIR